MTPGEVNRHINTQNKVKKLKSQEKATYDYIHAQLVVKGVSIVLGDKSDFPTIEQAYPGIFDEMIAQQEEKIREQKMSLSALRFKQFAQSYNDRFKNKEVPK